MDFWWWWGTLEPPFSLVSHDWLMVSVHNWYFYIFCSDEFSLLSCSVFLLLISFFLSISFDLIRCAAILSMWVALLCCPALCPRFFLPSQLALYKMYHSFVNWHDPHPHPPPLPHFPPHTLNLQTSMTLISSDLRCFNFCFCFHPHCTSLGLTKAPPTWIFYYLKHCFLYFSRNILIVTLLDCSLVKCELDSGPLSIHTHETS